MLAQDSFQYRNYLDENVGIGDKLT